MYIKIKLTKQTSAEVTTTYLVRYPVDLKGLENAIENCYLELATQYQPVRADNFIALGANQFPSIAPDTQLSISLIQEKKDKKCKSYDAQLVCCKAINVGKDFNNGNTSIVSNQWRQVFDLDDEQHISVPDGTLYVATDKKGKCVIATKKDAPETYIAYSMLFSFVLEERTYYFMLDPVVRVTSSGNG